MPFVKILCCLVIPDCYEGDYLFVCYIEFEAGVIQKQDRAKLWAHFSHYLLSDAWSDIKDSN